MVVTNVCVYWSGLNTQILYVEILPLIIQQSQNVITFGAKFLEEIQWLYYALLVAAVG